ncbi:MAG: SMC-Scp complex subunit ScpB [candidate division Zixibacteria bacterium]|nr:SMC-Scp complex subunit ScpB [candidate division Zixibacteria bacterium]
MNTNGNVAPIIEALIMSSPEPLPPRKIADVIADVTPSEVDRAVADLNNKYMASDSSFRIRKIAGGYQHYITENYASYIEDLNIRRRSTRLSRAALETLAIIAYRQPVTKTDVEMIRGVTSDSAIHTLLERKLVTLAGRSNAVGRPLLYKTTDEFLKYFNLNSHDDLPRMEEIEELISSKEPDNQESLPLGPFVNPHAVNGLKTEKTVKLTLRKPGEDDDFSPMAVSHVSLTATESTADETMTPIDMADPDDDEETLRDESKQETTDEDDILTDYDTKESASVAGESLEENDAVKTKIIDVDDELSTDESLETTDKTTSSFLDPGNETEDSITAGENGAADDPITMDDQSASQVDIETGSADDDGLRTTNEEHNEDYHREPEPVGILAEYNTGTETDTENSESDESGDQTTEQDRLN